ncbi:histidine kinase [Halapricum sp. CBA1109]|uniref:histidine kinase n=1 Tax=Halapricum sp. CBA1109 TaxID=2668068 RepID=UPI0012F8146D|nr:histidine kinase [Halapricum sp. CBA1109]MUV91159.1 histidine kinase [Halapricum sp. CBA1109]
MSTTTETAEPIKVRDGNWKAGTAAGIAGGLVMGVLVAVMNEPTVAVAIPSLYGLAPPANAAVGMVVHVSHAAVLGVAFAGIVGAVGLDEPRRLVGAGIGWGVLTWVVLAAMLMPVWLSTVGSPASPPFPNVAPPSLVWHLAYGGVLGAAYTALD